MPPAIPLEAEQAVLAGLLVQPDAYDLISDRFEPFVFGVPAHRFVAEAIVTLVAHKRPLDPVTIITELERQDRLEVATPEMVWTLGQGVGTAANLGLYLDTVRDAWALREARAAVSELLSDDAAENAEQLVAKVSRALSLVETGRKTEAVSVGTLLQRLSDELEAEHQRRPGTEIISTGFKGLDAVVGGFEPGIIQLYAARPSMGKSSLAVAFARALARVGVPVAVFWMEDTARKFATRVAAAEASIPTLTLRHGTLMQQENWAQLAGVVERVSKWPLYVEDTKGLTGMQLVARMRRMRRDHGIRVFLADHLGEVRLDLDKRESRRDEALGDVARMFRDTAHDLGVGACLFHQLGKRAEEGGTPRLGWLFNSDILGQVARVVGFLSCQQRTVEVNYQKVNYGPGGASVELGWDPSTMTIFQPEVK